MRWSGARMNKVINFSWSAFLLAVVTLKVSAQSPFFPNPITNYHHETLYPNNPGPIQASINLHGNPVSLNAGFYLKAPPTPLQLLQRTPQFFQHTGDFFRRPLLTAASLFTPNTVQQPAETKGQTENYQKALEEEATEAEKQQNDIVASFEGEQADLHGGELLGVAAAEQPRSFVSVQIKGGDNKDYNYNYSL